MFWVTKVSVPMNNIIITGHPPPPSSVPRRAGMNGSKWSVVRQALEVPRPGPVKEGAEPSLDGEELDPVKLAVLRRQEEIKRRDLQTGIDPALKSELKQGLYDQCAEAWKADAGHSAYAIANSLQMKEQSGVRLSRMFPKGFNAMVNLFTAAANPDGKDGNITNVAMPARRIALPIKRESVIARREGLFATFSKTVVFHISSLVLQFFGDMLN